MALTDKDALAATTEQTIRIKVIKFFIYIFMKLNANNFI
jgi:hypothetical protein